MNEFFGHIIEQFKLPLSNPVLVFALILFIILLSPLLLKRINIPGIVGLILSGVIIGPHGLHILEKNSAIELFSTIGLLYIMFIAGLDLDLNEFKSNRNKSLLFGFLTFTIPLTIGFPVCYYLLGYDFNASFLTASMFSTHTLIAYPIVSRLGISKSRTVATVVGGTILTDTAVLIILAVILGNNQGNLNESFWIRLGISLLIFSVIMFFIIPPIAKWFFHKLEGEKHAHYIFVLSIVFFSAFLAQLAGVESIIGAFVAGLALNRLIPHSSALMNRIEFIGNSLFIPFFLISVGMVVDVSVIMSGPMALMVALTLTTVALFSKWTAAHITRLILKYSKAQGNLMFGLSSSHAAATLAIILLGYKAKIIDANILNGTVILILVTCIVASIVTDKASKKIIIQSQDNRDTDPQIKLSNNNEHILLPIANISNFDKLLEFALLIKEKKSTNPISILSVVPNNEDAEINVVNARNKLQDFVKQASASEINVNVIAAIDYNSTSGIARTMKEILANILILGWAANTESTHRLLSDKIESIIHSNNKTVLVCHINQPLISIKQICIICPPLSEKEIGFGLWLTKMAKLAKELSSPITYYANESNIETTQKQLKILNLNSLINFKTYSNWDEFVLNPVKIQPTDLMVFINARRGSLSFSNKLESSLFKFEKNFQNSSKLLVYPQLFE